MTHPSIQGLREALFIGRDGCTCGFGALCPNCGWERGRAYLTEHGVGWFGEGLVRAVPDYDTDATAELVELVPVPQDGE